MTWRRIYLLRHGETDWNIRGIFRGRSDIELSQRGREQAKAAARALEGRGISAIYTSPVRRSVETAEFCSQELGLEFIEAPPLSDPDCGLWEGKDLEQARMGHPEEFHLMQTAPSRLRFPGGESVVEVADRVSDFALGDLDEEVDGDVLLVTHNFIFQVLTVRVLGCSLDRLYNLEMDNGAISEYQRRGSRVIVRRTNETDHLMGI